MENIDSQGENKPEKSGVSNGRRTLFVVIAIALVAVFWGQAALSKSNKKEISYSKLTELAESKTVLTATINNDNGKITGTYTDGKNKVTFEANGPKPPNETEIALFKDIAHFQNSDPGYIGFILSWLPFLVVIGLFYFFLIRRAQGQMTGIMNIGRSKAKLYSTERPKTLFADVAGYTGVKKEITEVVDFLKNPARFKAIGAKIPKGVLLVGPPGTGKTLLARAVAGEAGVPFLFITGSDFMEMFVGVGASRVRDLFQTARKNAPAIVFIDEIDSIGRKRGTGMGGGHDEREQTLNQILSEMDGFEATEGIVMLAATNRPDILDPALLRPGRFDREIVVPLPSLEERLPILKVHIRDKKIAGDVDLEIVARGTPGMSGADLANLANEAALHAVRREADTIHMEDFESARDRIFMGQRREGTVLSEDEKKLTAYHEGGHAVLGYVLHYSDPVHKVTILPTGMALGVTQQLPSEEKHSYNIEYIRDRLTVMMGGRVAEKLCFDTISTGGSDDLQKATEMARSMVREWGMSDRIGPMAWSSRGQIFLGEDMMQGREYSDETSTIIDEEVERILREEEQRAVDLLKKHRDGLEKVALALIEQETIDGDEVSRLVDEAHGTPVHPGGKSSPKFVTVGSPVSNGHSTPSEPDSKDPADKPVPLED